MNQYFKVFKDLDEFIKHASDIRRLPAQPEAAAIFVAAHREEVTTAETLEASVASVFGRALLASVVKILPDAPDVAYEDVQKLLAQTVRHIQQPHASTTTADPALLSAMIWHILKYQDPIDRFLAQAKKRVAYASQLTEI